MFSSFFRGTVHQFRERRLGVAHHICSNTFQEPGVAKFSARDCCLPRILVGIGQRAENHFRQRIDISEQGLLPVLTRRTCFEYFSRDAPIRCSDSLSVESVPGATRPVLPTKASSSDERKHKKVEFPVKVKGLFRPHYMSWSEQQRIEFQAPQYLRNIIRVITESGLRVYKELMSMKKEQVDLENAMVWIPDSKTPNGIAEVPLTELALEAFRDQIRIAGPGTWLFPSDENPTGHQKTLRTVWHAVLRRAKVPYFRIYDLRSTYATRLSAGGVADEWVTQLLRQGDAKVFKKYSQMKLQMKREALQKLNRKANEGRPGFATERPN